jgi:environmental stress-induced protein Ves
MSAPHAIAPDRFIAFPWKNGQGVTMDIAAAHRDGGRPGDWETVLWRFGRTGIGKPGPFSDMAGFERLQVVVEGRGLRLRAADSTMIDVRTPFVPVRFDGATRIDSVLDEGPVEVVNLIVRRDFASGGLLAAPAGTGAVLVPGVHVAYAAESELSLVVDATAHTVPAGHALRFDGSPTVRIEAGLAVIATVAPK